MTRDLLLDVVVRSTAPDAAAEGVHWRMGERYGLLIVPADAPRGRCWWCERPAIERLPLCQECAVEVWGEGPLRMKLRRQVVGTEGSDIK